MRNDKRCGFPETSLSAEKRVKYDFKTTGKKLTGVLSK